MRFGRESTECNAGWRVHEAAPFLIRAAHSKAGVRLSRPVAPIVQLGISGNLEGMKRGNRPYACIPVHFVHVRVDYDLLCIKQQTRAFGSRYRKKR